MEIQEKKGGLALVHTCAHNCAHSIRTCIGYDKLCLEAVGIVNLPF